MKILILSLLRLGDILLHKQLIAGLRKQYPGCQIDFAINDSFISSKQLLSEVKNIHVIPRNILQRILVEQEQSALAAYEKLGQFVNKINNENYNIILDATHNRLSVQLCHVLKAKEIRFAGSKRAATNLWESYFNNQFSQVNNSRFHYVDVLAKSLDVKSPSALLPKRNSSKTIIFQVLTSDVKKNWGLEKFKNLIDRVKVRNSDAECFIVCAPNELKEIQAVLSPDIYDIRALNLPEVKVALQSAALLVSGDTSIQHLAAEVGCSVVSLFIGSADAQKTAPFIKNALIVQATSACYPCKHSESCHQASHLCASSVTVDQVYKNIETSLKGELMNRLHDNSAAQTTVDQHGFMLMNFDGSQQSLAKDFERIVWSFYLNGEWKSSVPHYGSAVFEILNDWTHRYSMKAISQFATQQQTRVSRVEAKISEGKQLFSGISKACLNGTASQATMDETLSNLRSWHLDTSAEFADISDSFLKLQFALHKTYQDGFSLYREVKNSLEEPLNLNLIRQQLLLNLIRSLSEKGELNEREFRILS